MRRVLHLKRRFHCEAHETLRTPEKEFEIEFFSTLLDTALMSIKEGLEQLHEHAETSGLLYRMSELRKRGEDIKHCSDLQLALTAGSVQMSKEFL
jgi:hypothetical protein